MRRTALAALLLVATGCSASAPLPTDVIPSPTFVAAPDLSLANTKAHLARFQAIGEANDGNRRSDSPGYLASVEYVATTLTAAGFVVTRQECTGGCSAGAGPNVIADWPGGDESNVYMFGAHLDGVRAGVASNDNASGSSTVLELALTLARHKPTTTNHIRFAFWTDEEQGLNGSRFYVSTLTAAQHAALRGYLNFDMLGSTNGGYFIHQMDSPLGQPLKAYLDREFPGLEPEESIELMYRSDHAPFNLAAIPVGGFTSGAGVRKTPAQAAKWGGTADVSYDPCYHQACDQFPANINDIILDRAGDAAVHALWHLMNA